MFRATALKRLCHPVLKATSLPNSAQLQPSSFYGKLRNLSSSRPTSAVHYVRFGGPDPGQNNPRNKGHMKYYLGIGAAGAAYYVSHLEQVPETGRWRFMNIGALTEESIGKSAREETLREYQHQILPPNHVLSRHVRRVVTQILTASNLGHVRGESSMSQFVQPAFGSSEESTWDPDSQRQRDSNTGAPMSEKEWDVIVVNDQKIVNAMAVPGMVIVFTGILPICKDEKGLSAVLAHEIGHVVARHTAERVSSQIITYGILFLGQFLFGIDFGISNIIQSLVMELPNSRTQELEADKIGLKLMSRACYDPQGAVDMFERMTQVEKGSSVEFFNTHPSGKRRVEDLRKLLPEAYDVLNANPDCAAVQDRLASFRQVALGRQEMADF